jgi:hypothetical protein
MNKAKIIWIINLSLLTIVEVVFAFITGNPAKDFKAITYYTTEAVKNVSDNATNPTVLLVVFSAVIIFVMIRAMSMVDE